MQVPITLAPDGVGGVVSIESFNLNQAMNDRLLAGLWYVLVSTPANPNGELRAQVILQEVEDEETNRPEAQGKTRVLSGEVVLRLLDNIRVTRNAT